MGRFMKTRSYFVLFFLVLFLTGCLGGTFDTYRLRVKVIDELTTLPIVGATVEVVGRNTATKSTSLTGDATFVGLSGTYEVQASAPMFKSKQKKIVIDRNRYLIVELPLIIFD